jgi:hypothetical protein
LYASFSATLVIGQKDKKTHRLLYLPSAKGKFCSSEVTIEKIIVVDRKRIGFGQLDPVPH